MDYGYEQTLITLLLLLGSFKSLLDQVHASVSSILTPIFLSLCKLVGFERNKRGMYVASGRDKFVRSSVGCSSTETPYLIRYTLNFIAQIIGAVVVTGF